MEHVKVRGDVQNDCNGTDMAYELLSGVEWKT